MWSCGRLPARPHAISSDAAFYSTSECTYRQSTEGTDLITLSGPLLAAPPSEPRPVDSKSLKKSSGREDHTLAPELVELEAVHKQALEVGVVVEEAVRKQVLALLEDRILT